MKLRIIFVLCALIGILGCATANRISYKAATASYITVDLAMQAWGAYVALGKTTPAQELEVRNAYETYQKVVVGVASAAQALSASPNDPVAISTFQADLLGVQAAFNTLTALITKDGAK